MSDVQGFGLDSFGVDIVQGDFRGYPINRGGVCQGGTYGSGPDNRQFRRAVTRGEIPGGAGLGSGVGGKVF